MGTATDLAMALDPALWAEMVTGFSLDDWQRKVLRSSDDRVLMLCCRQAGKSTVASLLSLHAALYQPGTLALLLSPSLRQSSELFKKVAGFYQRMDEPVPSDAESALRIELSNGSRIVSLPGKERTVRGYSGVDLLVVDEAARVEDDLYRAVRPMLAVSGGRLVVMSTPFGRRGFFWEAWAKGKGWFKVKVTADECPRITDVFLEEELRELGRYWFNQEYRCIFQERKGQVFSYDLIQRTQQVEVEAWAI